MIQNHEMAEDASLESEWASSASNQSEGQIEALRPAPSNGSLDRSVRSTGTADSNIRNLTHRHNLRAGSIRSGTSKDGKGDGERGKEEDAITVPSIPSKVAPAVQPEEGEESHASCTRTNIVGATVCAVLAIGWVFFLFWERGGPNLITPEPTLPATTTGWNPPTSQQCSSIANGTLVADADPRERLLVNLEIQLRSALESLNATALESDWRNKLQVHVMPLLAGCEAVGSDRRLLLASEEKATLRQRQRQRQRSRTLRQQLLSDYVISQALVVDTTLSSNEMVSQRQQGSTLLAQSIYTYGLMVDIDIWLKEEVNDDLLVDKVSRVFKDFLDDAPLVSDLQLAESKLVNVQEPPPPPIDAAATDGPTVSDVAAASPAVAPTNPDPPTTAPVAMPTSTPIGFQTMTPSESPSVVGAKSRNPTGGVPITNGPMIAPGNQSLTESPTVSPANQSLTKNPTSNATMAPSVNFGSNHTEPTASPSTESPTLSPSNQTTVTLSPTFHVTTP